MKWLHRDTGDDNDDFIQMETANESVNGDVPCHGEAFEKGLRWCKVRELLYAILMKELYDSAVKQIWDS